MSSVLADLASAPIDDKLRATLAFLRDVTKDHAAITAERVEPLLALGITAPQIKDALAVAFCFNVITRLADTFEFSIPPDSGFETSAKMLLSRGYEI